MAQVVLIRGLNVGGHRRFRPAKLAAELRHLEAINIGAAGTLVIRQRIEKRGLRREIAERLPFEAEIIVCQGTEILHAVALDPFADQPERPEVVRFVSVLSRRPRAAPSLPLELPAGPGWLLNVLKNDGRFVFGLYRRQMKVISYLGKLDQLFGAPATTRGWSTMRAIATVLEP